MAACDIAALMDATWPAAAYSQSGPFLLRDGAGGGKRVSAASVEEDWGFDDLLTAEAEMEAPLFIIREGDEQLDQALAFRGYRVIDPVIAYHAPVARLAADLPSLSTFAHWPPLEVAREIWAEGGIGAARIEVMARVEGAKAALLGRFDDRPVGTAFVARSGASAMLHALEVRASARRRGMAGQLLTAAANWAAAEGAEDLFLVVTEQNLAARKLYEGRGMEIVGRYHYRGL